MNPESDIPDWVNWTAQDADGVIWGYEIEPLQHHQGWYENEVGRSFKIKIATANLDWQKTLIKIINYIVI